MTRGFVETPTDELRRVHPEPFVVLVLLTYGVHPRVVPIKVRVHGAERHSHRPVGHDLLRHARPVVWRARVDVRLGEYLLVREFERVPEANAVVDVRGALVRDHAGDLARVLARLELVRQTRSLAAVEHAAEHHTLGGGLVHGDRDVAALAPLPTVVAG